jgi:hypothetical protein
LDFVLLQLYLQRRLFAARTPIAFGILELLEHQMEVLLLHSWTHILS